MTQLSNIPPFRALVVEDHSFQRDIIVQALRLSGASEVREAVNGFDAISVMEDAGQAFDILICDLNMPGMDGLEFLRHMAERRCATSVILASGLNPSIIRTAEVMARTYGVRLLGAVEKPITRSKLLPLLLRHMGQQLVVSHPYAESMTVADIRVGMARHQFEPFFQPKINMRKGTLAGVEALMRWRHPDLGIIPPSAFIPAMELHGLITDATHRLLEYALDVHKGWQRLGQSIPIAINVAVESLADTQLPEHFGAMVHGAGLDPEVVTIEVTETSAMTDLGHSLETLARLRMKGFGLSIDDYGTGFSSMQQLARIPFNELKIDQAFVTHSGSQPVLHALLESSVGIGRRLGLKTVAEGVESEEDWEAVAQCGCDVAQGFFAARPMPAHEMLDWYDGWRGVYNARPQLGPAKLM
jgi:EAL domain-containing protein (putative c-di-GMP-specific phosphodiesterase class I)/FixJ family two-component response regulator